LSVATLKWRVNTLKTDLSVFALILSVATLKIILRHLLVCLRKSTVTVQPMQHGTLDAMHTEIHDSRL
jgi:hypothetical protein